MEYLLLIILYTYMYVTHTYHRHLYMYRYICIQSDMLTCMHSQTHTWHSSLCIHTCTQAYIQMYTHALTLRHTYTQSHAHKLRHTYTCIYVYINIHTCAHVLLAPTYAVMNTQVSSQRDTYIYTCETLVYIENILKKHALVQLPRIEDSYIHLLAYFLLWLTICPPSPCVISVSLKETRAQPQSLTTPLYCSCQNFVHLVIPSLWHGPLVFGFFDVYGAGV